MIKDDTLFWEIFEYLKGYRSDPTKTSSNKTETTARDVVDKSTLLFEKTIDRVSFLSDDYLRLKSFLIDWYSSHKTIITQQKNITDPYTHIDEYIEELIKSFGFTTLPDHLSLDEKINFFLELVNLYKIKGTPTSISGLMRLFGLNVSVHEYWLERHSIDETVLKFRGYNTDLYSRRAGVEYPYSKIINSDPHWFYRHPDDLINLADENKISFPIKTKYFSINPGSYVEKLKAIIATLSTKIFVDYQYWLNNGDVPDEPDILTDEELNDPDILDKNTKRISVDRYEKDLTVTFLEIFISFCYLFKKAYGDGGYIQNPHTNILMYVGREILNSGTYHTDYPEIPPMWEQEKLTPAEIETFKETYENFLNDYTYYSSYPVIPPAGVYNYRDGNITKNYFREIYKRYNDLVEIPSDRIDRELKLYEFNKSFTTELVPYGYTLVNSPLNFMVDANEVFEIMNPELKAYIDSGEDIYEEFEYITKKLNDFIYNFIVYDLDELIVNIKYQNLFYYICGFNTLLTDKVLESIDFFKPYRAKLIDLKEIISFGKLEDSIRLQDSFNYYIKHIFHDFPSSNSIPCCDDSTSCLDSSETFDPRKYYDCGGYYDRGMICDSEENTKILITDRMTLGQVICLFSYRGLITEFLDYSGTVPGTVRVTSTDHGLESGKRITITDSTNYNNTYTITIINTNSFYFEETFSGNDIGIWRYDPVDNFENDPVDLYDYFENEGIDIYSEFEPEYYYLQEGGFHNFDEDGVIFDGCTAGCDVVQIYSSGVVDSTSNEFIEFSSFDGRDIKISSTKILDEVILWAAYTKNQNEIYVRKWSSDSTSEEWESEIYVTLGIKPDIFIDDENIVHLLFENNGKVYQKIWNISDNPNYIKPPGGISDCLTLKTPEISSCKLLYGTIESSYHNIYVRSFMKVDQDELYWEAPLNPPPYSNYTFLGYNLYQVSSGIITKLNVDLIPKGIGSRESSYYTCTLNNNCWYYVNVVYSNSYENIEYVMPTSLWIFIYPNQKAIHLSDSHTGINLESYKKYDSINYSDQSISDELNSFNEIGYLRQSKSYVVIGPDDDISQDILNDSLTLCQNSISCTLLYTTTDIPE